VPSREEIVERSIEGFDQADWALLESLWDPGGEIVAPESWPEGGTISGWTAILAQFKRLKDSWAEDRIEVLGHTWNGDRVLSHMRWSVRGEASGLPVGMDVWMVSELRGDRFVRAQYFTDGDAAKAALEADG
jgi:ketosteroid isomerase-like protein